MCTSKNIPNSVEVAFADTFASFKDLFDKTAMTTFIAEDKDVGLSDDNDGSIGVINNMVDEVMFNMVSTSFQKSYNSVNKMIL